MPNVPINRPVHSRILVVDDNEQNAELLVAYLETLDCEIQTAHDGMEAMALVAVQGARHYPAGHHDAAK